MNEFKQIRTNEIYQLWQSGILTQSDAKEMCFALDKEWSTRLNQDRLTVGDALEEWARSKV